MATPQVLQLLLLLPSQRDTRSILFIVTLFQVESILSRGEPILDVYVLLSLNLSSTSGGLPSFALLGNLLALLEFVGIEVVVV